MHAALRHGLAIFVLPFMVVVVIPAWIWRAGQANGSLPASAGGWLAVAVGAVCLAAGAALFSASLLRFGTEGGGTLAPWDPPRELVVRGPYAFVRNPMISGVILLLLAEGLVLRSPAHLQWAGAFFVINAVYIPLLEEPRLRRRFGEAYRAYERSVPRLLPRLSPWREGE